MKKIILAAAAALLMATGAVADTSLPDNIAYGEGAIPPTQRGATAYGVGALADGAWSTSYGSDAEATAYGATAVGVLAEAGGIGSTAVGISSEAAGTGSVAVGLGSGAQSYVSVAIGTGANVEPGAYGSIALGNVANVSERSSVAIGAGANVLARDSVAIGSGSVATEERTVAVGGRRIVGVVDGIQDTDAVNVRQLNRAVTGVEKYAAQGVAASMAVPTVQFASAEDTKAVGINVGHYGGEMALGVAGAVKLTPSLAFQAGFASPLSSGGSVAVRGGLSYSWK